MTSLTALPRDTNLHADKLRMTAPSSFHFYDFFILAQTGDFILAQSGDPIKSYGYDLTISARSLHAPPRDTSLRVPSS